MGLHAYRRAGVALVASAAMVGVAGCGSDSADGVAGKWAEENQSRSTATEVLTAAYEKTAGAKSAKIDLSVEMPDGIEGGGEMKLSGVMGWDPTVMDVTMTGSALESAPEAPDQIRMLWRDNVMYMDMGEAASADMDGKRWMKLDLAAMAKESGDEDLTKQMTNGLDDMNQDPAQQLAMLLESPNLKHVGPQKVDGVQTQHYKGTLTVSEMMESNDSLGMLDKKERKELLDTIEEAGIEGYDTEVWVNEDGYPVRMDVGMESPEGTVSITAKYSDYGTGATVKTPPASDTVDLFKKLKEIGEDAGGEGGLGGSDGGLGGPDGDV
ncbi:LolA-like protein [Streptomyces apocyni]|uniref:hypothetical protein n=1 Tax=Streptomyces apocyni TaxID=2654677 RepID=UPI0012EAAFE2|nr:hypothetical protein [Streptomyces apocyni]